MSEARINIVHSSCVVFGQRVLCVFLSFTFLFLPLMCVKLIIVKMFHLLAMHLSRCVIFRQGALYRVCSYYICISALNVLSRCFVFRQCTCQDVLSFGKGPCICVFLAFMFLFLPLIYCQDVSSFGRGSCACVCSFLLPFYFCP